MSVVFSAHDHLITLDGEIDVACSAELKEVLQTALTAGRARLDLSAVHRFDITAIQLLWAAARHAQNAGISFVLQGAVPNEVEKALRTAGFATFPLPAGEIPGEPIVPGARKCDD